MTLLFTRLMPPRRERGVLARELVPRALSEMACKRLTLVQAPAGYGKSLFMGQIYDALASTSAHVGWVSLAELDGSMREFARYVVASVHAAREQSSPGEFDWLLSPMGEPPCQNLLSAICNEMHSDSSLLTIFLDDVHVFDGTSAMRLLDRLIRDAPSTVSFVLGSRTCPDVPIARLRAHGELFEVGPDGLRFSLDETVQFLSSGSDVLVPVELAQLAVRRTEGWPAGLQLLSILDSRGHDLAMRLAQFSGADRGVADYLREDMLERLPEAEADFLLRSSIFRQFTPALCDEVLDRSDSLKTIAQLERSGMFIFSLDTTADWFRYHHLFREYFEKRMIRENAALRVILHRRAARAFHLLKMSSEALYHACEISDFEFAASVIDAECEEAFYQGRLWSLASWIEKIPEKFLDVYPRMQLARIWSLTLELKFEEAGRLIDRVQSHVEALAGDGNISPQGARDLDRIVLHRKMMIAQFADDLPETERLCNKLLIDFPNDEEPFLRGSLDASLANAHRELYKLDSLDELDRTAREYFGRTGTSYPLVFLDSIVGSSYLQRGETDRAFVAYGRAISIATEIAGPRSPLTAMPGLLRARLMLERADFAAARVAFDSHLPLAGGVGFVDQLITGYVGRARLAVLDGEPMVADELCARGGEFAAARRFSRLHWNLLAERVRQCLLRHDVKEAERFASRAGLPADPSSIRPQDGVTTSTGAMAAAWIRLAISHGATTEAEDLARRWIQFSEKRNCVTTELSMRCLCASARLAAGDVSGASRMISAALSRVGRSGLVLNFVEEGEQLRSLASRMIGHCDEGQTPKEAAKSIAIRLSRGFGVLKSDAERSNPLDRNSLEFAAATWTRREIEILGLVAHGDLNREIGGKLGLTEGTVKWYMQQIYSKMGIRRRLDAVQRARELGLVR